MNMQKNVYEKRQMKAGLSALLRLRDIPLLLLGGYLLMCTSVFAQSGEKRTVTGSVVTDGSTEAIPGASVVIKGTPIGTTTDTKGEFSLEASSGSTLVISFIGYETKEVLVGNKTRIEVILAENISNLQEVVVVGYGEMKRTDLSSSQITVSGKELNRTINTSFEQGLQGRAANVNVTQSSGQPGAAPTVIIRGLSTLTGSAQPLYVIDGVQIKPDNFKDDPNNRPTGFSNILSSINPDDIETVNILQGPSATAIFGATGANGVVMITTKRGKAGETKISFNTSLTLQAKPDYIAVMKLPDYARFRNEMERAGGTASDDAFLDPSVLGQGTNWQDELYRPTLMQKYSLGLSGGTEKSSYYFSGEYFDQDGVAPGSGFNRYSTRLNLENQTRKWLKIGTSLSVGFTREKVNTTNGDLVKLALEQNPSVPVKNPDGSWGGPTSTQFQYTNPVMIANLYNDYNRRTTFLGGLYGDIKFLKNFTWHNEVNGSMEYFKYYSFHPGYQGRRLHCVAG
jgi:TonB-linked SusC/RagA family outer membrane protein